MKWFKPTIFALLAIAGAAFLILGSHQPRIAPPGFVVVEYWEKWIGNEGSQMQQIVTDFNNSVGREKKIYVRYMSMTDSDDRWEIIKAHRQWKSLF